MGSLAGSPWPFRKNYEPIRPSGIQDVGPPSPRWLSPKPARRRRPNFSPHEENHGRPTRRSRLQEASHEKADSKKPAPVKRSRPYPQSLHPPSGDETGRGYSEACHPRIPEHAWHSAPYGWPWPVQHGTIATLTLMSSTTGRQRGPRAVGPFGQRDTRRRPCLPQSAQDKAGSP